MKRNNFSREEVTGMLQELLERPDLLVDAVGENRLDNDAESLLNDAEHFYFKDKEDAKGQEYSTPNHTE